MKPKMIYPVTVKQVPVELYTAVKDAYELRKPFEPKLRMVDVWMELVRKVQK